jgi:hypothetical protein
LAETAFKRHVASIEELKRRAGILIQTKDLSKDDRSELKDLFLKELIGLNLEEFDSITFDQLIQRAHTGNLGLDLAGKNKSTLAKYFHLKELKAFAKGQRPADEASAPVERTVQVQTPPDPQAPGAAAAIDGQGQLGPGVKRPRPVDVFEYPPRKRPLGVFEPSGESEAEDSGPGLAPQLANPAQPEAGGSGLGSSSAQKPVNRRSEPRAELRPEYGVCIIFACLVLVLKHFEFCNIWQIKKILILKMIMVFQCAQSLAR